MGRHSFVGFVVRNLINRFLRPFGWCIGRIIRVEQNVGGNLVERPLPTGWRAYRVLPLRKA